MGIPSLVTVTSFGCAARAPKYSYRIYKINTPLEMPFSHLPDLPPSVYIAGLVSFIVAIALVATKHLHGRFTMDGTVGIQKMHITPTPRIGGLAIFLGVAAAWVVAAPTKAAILGVLLFAGLPAFLFGVAEDLTKQVSVLARLLATFGSGLLGWLMTGISLGRLDIPLIDPLLGYTIVSVAFTAFAVGGIANAVNIVDGFNGLASGFVAIAISGIGLAAAVVDDVDLAVACFAMVAAIIGFWLVNWPLGKLFLGDGGSYFSGFALAWASVLLIERNAGITAFFPLLICVHPVTEVLFSIYRRRMTRRSPGAPDRLHLHTLLMRRLVAPRLARLYAHSPRVGVLMRNPVTGFLVACMTLPSVTLALLVMHSAIQAAAICLLFALGYVTLYARLVRFRWCSPLNFLFVKPKRIILAR
jgi:UDP-N-acetylmuramyl pentapeptide phosphotransferase/UDP-N-acetylglucosamine-1-phosphate transferase